MKFYEFVGEFKRLNPNVDIVCADPRFSNDAMETIYLNTTEKHLRLNLPKGFEYNEKNGITNKHHTQDGSYMSIKVEHNRNNEFPLSPQKTHNEIVKDSAKVDDNADWDFYSFFHEFKRLNPTLQLNVAHPQFSPNATNEIFFTPTYNANMTKEVIAPEGFVYDKATKTYSNKHNSKSGFYMDVKIQNTAKLKHDVSNTFMTDKQLKKYYAQSEKLKPIYSNLIPDVSETTDKFALLYAIQKLNPDIDFSFINPEFGNSESMYYSGKLDLENLKLPDGFEYNEKNGITNKHNTKSGLYTAVRLESSEELDQGALLTQEQLNKQFKKSNDLKEVYPAQKENKASITL